MAGIGESLRTARTARGLSLKDVQQELHIREKYLEALEGERFEAIPGIVYARGFLRTYARYLGLDPDALSEQMPTPPERPLPEPRAPQQVVRGREPAPKRPIQRRKGGRQWPWVVLPLVFIAALLYYFGTRQTPFHPGSTPKAHSQGQSKGSGGSPGGGSSTGGNGTQGTQTGTTPPSQPALASQPATQAPLPLGGPEANYTAPKGPIQVSLTLSGQCWLDVEVDGNTVYEAMQGSGTFTYTAQSSFFIKLGNPPVASLTVDGQKIPLQGTNAQSVSVKVQG